MRTEDADAFAALVRLAFATHNADPPPSALGLTADTVRNHLQAGGGLVSGAPYAGLLWRIVDDALAISRLAVHPAWRGQGLARMLLDAADHVARDQGCRRVTLSTRLAFTGNRRLFAAAGFREGALHSHPGYAQPTFVDLDKTLAPVIPQKGRS